MRVGLLIYGSLETRSGGYLYDRYLVRYLRSQGDQVEVISLPWRNYAAHLGDNLSLQLARRLRGLEIDILVQDELNHPSLAWLNGWLKPQLRYPIISLVHHLRSDELRAGWQNWLYRQVERRYLASVDGFIFNSHTTRRAVAAVLGGSLQPPAVVATPGGDRFSPQLGSDWIEYRSYRADYVRFMFLGSLTVRKGLHTLLAALARLPSAGWQLRVIGSSQAEPGYARDMQALAQQLGLSERVHFLGEINDQELPKLMAESHALVVPSSYEGFGIVYLEAMGFGVPVVGGQQGGAAEIIAHGENGYLVPSEEPQLLAEFLANWLQDRSKLAEMGIAARRRYEQFPGWQDSMARIRAFLGDQLGV